MKSKSPFRSFLAIAGSSLLAISSASAQLYWDSNAAATGAGGTPSGTWGTSAFWNTDSAGLAGTFSASTANTDDLFFVAGPATGSGNGNATITVSAAQVANSLTSQHSGNFTLSGGTSITLGNGTAGSGGITLGALAFGSTNQGALTISTPIVLNNAQTWTNQSPTNSTGTTGSLNASGTVTLGASTLTLAGTGITYTTGVISGTGGLTVNGGRLWLAAGAAPTHTYSGTTTLNGGVTMISGNLPITSNLVMNGGILESYWTTGLNRNQGVDPGQIQIIGGESGFSMNGSTGATFNIGAITWGSATFNPTKFVLNSQFSQNNAASTLSSAINLNGADRTIIANGGVLGNASATISGAITNSTGTAGLVKEGLGLLTLSATNTYNGGTTITGGTLAFGGTATMPNAGLVAVGAGTGIGINLGGTGNWTTGTSGVGTLGGLLAGVGSAGTSTITYTGNVGLRLSVNGNVTYSGVIADVGTSLAIIKAGNNTLELTGANTYTGNTTLNLGTLAISAANNLGNASSNLIFNSSTLGTLRITGTTLANVADLGRTVTFASGAGVGFDISTPSHTFTLGQILNHGAGSFTKDGQGTLVINQANTYTGVTTVAGGGNLVLDYSAGQDNRKLGTGGFVFTGAGTITLKGGSASTIENLSNAGTTLNAGHTFITRVDSSVAKLRFNGIARAAAGTISFVDATVADTDNNNFGASGANGILGGWATLGNDWAVSVNTSANNTAITALASYTPFANSVGSSTANYLLNGPDALTGATAVGSLKINNSANSQSLDLGANDLTVTSASAAALGGIMYAGGNDNLYSIIGTGRILPSTANQELIFAVPTGTLTVGSPVAAAVSTSPVTKSGSGTLVLSAANTYTGATRINQGTLALGASNVFAATPILIGNATLDAATFTDTVGTLDPVAGATINLGSGGALAFANSSGVDWTGGTLRITGTLDFSGTASSSLRFGTAASHLTAAQLALISSPGWTGFALNASGYLTATPTGGPGLDNFLISAISSPQTVGTPITGITLTARDASNATVTTFTGTVNFGGSGGFGGTSASFTAGVLSGVSVTPTVAGSNLTFTVDDGAGKSGSATITTIRTQYQGWSGGAPFASDANSDGVSNGMAFLLGAASPSASALGLLPTVTQTGGGLVLNFSMLNAASRGTAALSVQHSSDLGIGDPWDSAVVPASSSTLNDVVFVISGSGPLGVQATIPSSKAAAGKLFGRLRATE